MNEFKELTGMTQEDFYWVETREWSDEEIEKAVSKVEINWDKWEIR